MVKLKGSILCFISDILKNIRSDERRNYIHINKGEEIEEMTHIWKVDNIKNNGSSNSDKSLDQI